MAFGVKNIHRKQKKLEKKNSFDKKKSRGKLSILLKLKRKLREYRRVLRITKKPTSKEFKMIVKVTGLGIVAIGAIGFVIWLVLTLIE